jgi:hypothetical protein
MLHPKWPNKQASLFFSQQTIGRSNPLSPHGLCPPPPLGRTPPGGPPPMPPPSRTLNTARRPSSDVAAQPSDLPHRCPKALPPTPPPRGLSPTATWTASPPPQSLGPPIFSVFGDLRFDFVLAAYVIQSLPCFKAPQEPPSRTAAMDQRKADNHAANGGLVEMRTSRMKFDSDDEVNPFLACGVWMP